jgi:hypothetical protein
MFYWMSTLRITVTDMPMKEGLRPKKHIVIRDLKRGVLTASTKEGEINGTLLNQWIPEEHMRDHNPNHPLETDVVNCWDVKLRRWNNFKISELETYNAIGSEPRAEANETGVRETEDPRRTGNRGTEETPQKT